LPIACSISRIECLVIDLEQITLDRELEIEDYISGVTPSEFIKFVYLVRRFEPVLGLDSLALTEQEEAYRNKATKSVVALSNLDAGDVLTLDTVALKRCSKSITKHSILEIEQAIGKTLFECEFIY
jgi:sialic acid synthase SpsE